MTIRALWVLLSLRWTNTAFPECIVREKDRRKHASVEIFVNDGDAVFTSRVFPAEGEHFCSVTGDSFTKMWSMKRAVKEQFLV